MLQYMTIQSLSFVGSLGVKQCCPRIGVNTSKMLKILQLFYILCIIMSSFIFKKKASNMYGCRKNKTIEKARIYRTFPSALETQKF